MSSSFPAAAPSLLPTILLPSGTQLVTGTQSAAQPKNSANSFTNLIDQLIQEITPQPAATNTPALVRIPLPAKVRATATPAPETAPTAEKKAPKLPGEDPTILISAAVVQPPPVVLPRIALQPAPAAEDSKTSTLAANDKAPEVQPTPAPEPQRLPANDTVMQIRLRTAETEAPAPAVKPALSNEASLPVKMPGATTEPQVPHVTENPAPLAPSPRAAQKESTHAVKTSAASQVPLTHEDSSQQAGDDRSKQFDSQSDADHGEPRQMPQRPMSPQPMEAQPGAQAQPQTVTNQMIVPAAAIVEKQLPPAPAPAAVPAAPHAALTEPEPPAASQQQVRSVALEFTPDGGRDVRLRVVERAGEVHVTLHSSDADLTGKLREGVRDLAGSLSNAGYDGEAWTPRDNGRQQQQPQQQEAHTPARRHRARSHDSNEFAGLFNNPVQETK